MHQKSWLSFLAAAALGAHFLACGVTGEPDAPDDTACEACLAEEGAWYPGAALCEASCIIADAACFTDRCPPPCDETCEGCFARDACEAQACTWSVEDELQWCVPPTMDPCEDCLAAGGTWQPEVEECTVNCDIMDVSCFIEECPGSCGERCGFCFSEEDCQAAGCQWAVDAEAMWCSGTPAP